MEKKNGRNEINNEGKERKIEWKQRKNERKIEGKGMMWGKREE